VGVADIRAPLSYFFLCEDVAMAALALKMMIQSYSTKGSVIDAPFIFHSFACSKILIVLSAPKLEPCEMAISHGEN
jgi:hypothetical protein